MLRSLLISLLLGPSILLGQIQELSPAMHWTLAQWDDRPFSLFVQADAEALQAMEAERRGTILGTVAGYTMIHTDKQALLSMVDEGMFSYLGLDWDSGRPLNDLMVLNNNIFPAHEGAYPIDHPLTGAGVLMGVVDSGVEMAHPDFIWPEGGTRIAQLWDQTYVYDIGHIPPDFGYGTLWTALDIDSGIAQHQDQPQWYGHGSTVTGTACGNGTATGEYMGVAPESDMAVVSFDFARPGFRSNVANSVQWVYSLADAMGLPAVVNLSLGSYFGSHDGLDPATLYIDSLITAQPGRIAVCAVGNSGHLDPYHLRVELEEDTAFTWFEYETGLFIGNAGVFFELWADTADIEGLEFSLGADQLSGAYAARGEGTWMQFSDIEGQLVDAPILNDEGDLLGNAQYWGQVRGGQVQIQALVIQPDSSQYAFRFMSKGTGAYDIWSTSTFGTSDMIQAEDLPTAEEFPPIVHYRAPDNEQHMVDAWACSEQVITVGNYTNRVSYTNYLGGTTTIAGTQGDIYQTSSAGPSRSGLVKPDLAATGSTTLSTGNFSMLNSLILNEPQKVAPGGMHFRNGGSSMASPVVAGVAALYLQQCPLGSHEEFKAALHSTSAIDDYTGAVPNARWGLGKLNGYGALAYLSIEAPLMQEGDSLYTQGGEAYQWYLDGEPIPGATDAYLLSTEDGVYQVEVFGANGCSKLSQPALYTDVPEPAAPLLAVYPTPVDEQLTLRSDRPIGQVELSDSYGRLLLSERFSGQEAHLDMRPYGPGVYLLRMIHGDQQILRKVIKR